MHAMLDMKYCINFILLFCISLSIFSAASASGRNITVQSEQIIDLPDPVLKGSVSVEQTLHQRRSIRSFADSSLTIEEIGQMLWAAQGVTHPRGLRTAPSAGATYPLETYLTVRNVKGLKPGIYHYMHNGHKLKKISDQNMHAGLTAASYNQQWMLGASAMIVLSSVTERTSGRYGARAERYVAMEIGAAVQNIHLQGMALGIGSTFVGAFNDAEIKKIMHLREEEDPLAIVPFGRIQ